MLTARLAGGAGGHECGATLLSGQTARRSGVLEGVSGQCWDGSPVVGGAVVDRLAECFKGGIFAELVGV